MSASLLTVTPARLLELGSILINRRVAGGGPPDIASPFDSVFASCLDVASGIENHLQSTSRCSTNPL